MPVRIYNTLSRKKEEFVPLSPGSAGVYCCGPTVYDHAHIGHAKLYIAMDVVVRYLRFAGLTVKYVQNITDVGHLTDDADAGEDKVAKKAAAERLDPMELVERCIRSYFDDMDALGVQRPNISPRASAHIPEQIEIIKTLIEKGRAYESGGSVYFDITSIEDYGKLSGRRLEEMEAGARVDLDEKKRHPADFLLWRNAAPKHILRWPSPWGWGYPGWHLECSAMAKRYLGDTFDIHGGGLENMFPHNEDEIAQSEAANDAPFARYWIHINSLTVGGQKMGKSLGNAVYLKEALGRWTPEAIRLFILSTHYRSVLDFTPEAQDAAEQGLKRLTTCHRLLKQPARVETGDDRSLAEAAANLRARFCEAMEDDFNTPTAIAAIFDFCREANTALAGADGLDPQSVSEAQHTLEELAGDVLGILSSTGEASENGDLGPRLMEILIETRSSLRQAKQYELADGIRGRLTEAGIELEDRPGETIWRRID